MNDEKEPLGRVIYLTSLEMRNLAEKIVKPFGLTLEQFILLKSMVYGAGVTQRQLGEKVHKKPANITRMLDRLEAKDFVVRRDDPDDRRALLVFLTEMGLELVEKVEGVFQSYSAQLFSGISDNEQQIIRNSFGRMSTNIQRMTEKFNQNSLA